MKKRLTTEELARSHYGLCGVSIGDGDCSCLVHWVAALQKELDEKELQIADLKKMVDGWREDAERYAKNVDFRQKQLEESNRLNGEYRKVLEAIANDKEGPFYPDGDAMSENTCAKIALGIACPLCGSPAPCTYHKNQEQEKRNDATRTCKVSWPGTKMDDSDRTYCGRPLPCSFHNTK